jgi:hypothetical protein
LMGALPTVWLTAFVLSTTAPPVSPRGDALSCDEPVCVSATLHQADGTEFTGEGLARATLGEVLEWTVDVAAPSDAGVFVPSNPALGSFRLVRSLQEDLPVPAGSGQRRTRTRLTLRALRMGAEAIPPIEITWRLADGSTGSFETPRRRVRVAGRLDNEQDPALGGRPLPASVVATNWMLVTLAMLLGGALLAVLLTPLVRRLRRGRALAPPPPPPRPANEVALEALAWLESAELSPEERYGGAVDTLRAYLGGRYEFDGLESTTAELKVELDERETDGAANSKVHAILDDADLVKFAKLIASAEEAMALVHRVREIVLATWVEVLDSEPESEVSSSEPGAPSAVPSEPPSEAPPSALVPSEVIADVVPADVVPADVVPEPPASPMTPSPIPVALESETTEALPGEES